MKIAIDMDNTIIDELGSALKPGITKNWGKPGYWFLHSGKTVMSKKRR